MKPHPSHPRPLLLGVDGGGTHTRALLADGDGRPVTSVTGGPANLRLLSDSNLRDLLRALRTQLPIPDALAIGLAGARTADDRERILAAAAAVWPGVPCVATHDLETALRAAEPPPGVPGARVLVLSGTGSCCYGLGPDGSSVRAGGWGHHLGDAGSGYDIARRAFRAVVEHHDVAGRWPRLGAQLLRAVQLNQPEDLIAWMQEAGKDTVASAATAVFRQWARGDRLAAGIIEAAADELAKFADACARRLRPPDRRVQFVFAGGVLSNQPRYRRLIAALLRQRWPEAVFTPLTREAAAGAVELARAAWEQRRSVPADTRPKGRASPPVRPLFYVPTAGALADSPTEQRNPRSMRLDRMGLEAAIGLMLLEDARLPRALLAERSRIAAVVRRVARSLAHGGRLFYVGAGTSGRLGVLDASECPPTFGSDPEQVQGIIAGGPSALWQSVEGAEDDPAAGAAALRCRGVRRGDVVVGIAASGRTPFVWGALAEGRKHGATTVLLCFNPTIGIARAHRPDIVIAPAVGPEILTGSTRLKAGTATKLVLNLITTLAMVRLGKVISNLMVDLNPSNVKLRDRAARIVSALTGHPPDAARRALERSRWRVANAVRTLRMR